MLHTAVVLDAAMPVDEALSRLNEHRADARAIVRRQIGLQLFYYVFLVEHLIPFFTPRDAGDKRNVKAKVASAIDLDQHTLADIATADQLSRHGVRKFGRKPNVTVILDGASIVGIWEPDSHQRGGGQRAVVELVTGSPRARAPAPQSPPQPSPSQPAAAPAPKTKSFGRLPDLPDFLKRGRGATRSGSASEATAELATPVSAPAPQPVAAAVPIQFRAHPRLELESDVVAPGARFDLTIGLAKEAVPNVSGGLVTAELAAGTTEFDLDAQLVADGFESPAGWFFRLRVPVSNPERGQVKVTLIAPNDATTRLSLLEVHFSHRGTPCGVAFRKIAVQASEPTTVPPRPGGQAWVGEEPTSTIVLDPSEPPPADLWITISKPDGNDATGKFVWGFRSPHSIRLPAKPIEVDLGADARTFAEKMIKTVTRAEGTALIDQALASVGRQVRDKAPAELEEVLQAVWGKVHPTTNRPPTILLQTAEPHVPWELARLNDPPDAKLPPFLGAQFTMGRWIFGARGLPVPPAREIPVRAMAVVAGDYRSSLNHRPLAKAEAEGEELAKRWGALRLKATVEDMNALLEGGLEQNGTRIGGTEAIHFACHGEVDPRNPQDAMIYLDNDWPLEASLFLEAPVGKTHQPFLFLNACQVGQSGEVLGDYAGFAGFCLRSGFRGFVAPLWSVSDEVAHEIALQFYDAAFKSQPVPIAEVLRTVRCRYPLNERVPPSTWLAYVYYGHPDCVLRRA
jgi:hypothetical protein